MRSHLPPDLRPQSLSHKILVPGLHLPADFISDIKSIDQHLYFVFHQHRVTYDDLMNRYYGALEDPRYTIGEKHGIETWGWIMTDNEGAPLPDNTWHIWQLAKDKGWSHVANLPSTDNSDLNVIVNRLGKEKLFKAKFGAIAWNHHLRKEKEDRDAQEKDAKDQRFLDIQRENRGLTKRAMENYERGVFAPTNPTREVITSYSNQGNKSKIVRPLTEKEAGLVTGEDDG